MSTIEWEKIEPNQFIERFGIKSVVKYSPHLLYSKKDKEHEAITSLVLFFVIAGAMLIYIAISIILNIIIANLIAYIIIIAVVSIIELILLFNYIRTNIYIKPLECWVEFYEGKQEATYCISYYPIFSGKSHPNRAKNIIYKLFQEEVLKSKVDITQIEFYIKMRGNNEEPIGYFFQYGEGKQFKDEDINRNVWQFFPYEKMKPDNLLAVANWEHQYEWREDLQLDFDKLHQYAPWVIRRWNPSYLKFLTEDYKENFNWKIRPIDSIPKLIPWQGNISAQGYKMKNAYRDIDIINKAIEKIMGDKEIKEIKDIEDHLLEFKAYFRDLDV